MAFLASSIGMPSREEIQDALRKVIDPELRKDIVDAASAAPITGNRRGGFDEVLDVFVEVQQQSSAQQ